MEGWSSAHQTLLGLPLAGMEGVPYAAGWEGLCESSEFCWDKGISLEDKVEKPNHHYKGKLETDF